MGGIREVVVQVWCSRGGGIPPCPRTALPCCHSPSVAGTLSGTCLLTVVLGQRSAMVADLQNHSGINHSTTGFSVEEPRHTLSKLCSARRCWCWAPNNWVSGRSGPLGSIRNSLDYLPCGACAVYHSRQHCPPLNAIACVCRRHYVRAVPPPPPL